jgi:hypothetical protein
VKSRAPKIVPRPLNISICDNVLYHIRFSTGGGYEMNWVEVGPKLIAALEDIDCALHTARRRDLSDQKRRRLYRQTKGDTDMATNIAMTSAAGLIAGAVLLHGWITRPEPVASYSLAAVTNGTSALPSVWRVDARTGQVSMCVDIFGVGPRCEPWSASDLKPWERAATELAPREDGWHDVAPPVPVPDPRQ